MFQKYQLEPSSVTIEVVPDEEPGVKEKTRSEFIEETAPEVHAMMVTHTASTISNLSQSELSAQIEREAREQLLAGSSPRVDK